jgi:hypothetical protein
MPLRQPGFDSPSRPDLRLVWKNCLVSVTLRPGACCKHFISIGRFDSLSPSGEIQPDLRLGWTNWLVSVTLQPGARCKQALHIKRAL